MILNHSIRALTDYDEDPLVKEMAFDSSASFYYINGPVPVLPPDGTFTPSQTLRSNTHFRL
jgi:hypothetical protein